MPIADRHNLGFLQATRAMSIEDKQHLAALLQEMQNRGMQIPRELLSKSIARWFPDENGYFVRADGRHYKPYQSQIDFINSNSRFALFYGSRGCIDGSTEINGIPIAERKSIGLVSTLHGNKFASDGFIRGKDYLYKVTTQLGNSVVVTKNHQFLTPIGWLPLNQLSVGDAILSDGTSYAENWKRKSLDYLVDYSHCFHLYDELHNLLEEASLNILQQLHKIVYDNSALDDSFHLSIVDFLLQMLYQPFLEYSFGLFSYTQLLLKIQESFLSLYIHILDYIDLQLHQEREFLLDYYFPFQYEFPCDVKHCLLLAEIFPICEQLLSDYVLSDIQSKYLSIKDFHLSNHQMSDKVVLGDPFLLSLFPINKHNYNVRFNKIQDIKFERFGDFYDIQVPFEENYLSNGIYHHNCGKSATGTQKALKKIQDGQSGAILNPDFENFRISTWPEFREWLPWDNVVPPHRYRRNIQWQPYQPFVMAFTNGARVICKGLKEPDSARGPNINWLWYDEVSRDETGEAWKTAVASVRIGYMPQAWATGTPNTKAPWVRKFFIDQDMPQDAIDAFALEGLGRELVETFYGNIEMNKDNLDPGFYASLLAAYPSGWLRKQEVMGIFTDESGTLGDSSWFNGKVVSAPPEHANARARFWDLAATEKKLSGKKKNDPDASASTRMSYVKEPYSFYIEDQTNDFMKWEDLIEEIIRVAQEDGKEVKVFVEQEPASGGKNQVAIIDLELKKRIPGHPGCTGYRPSDRVIGANIWFAEAAAGNMYLVYGAWNKPFLSQLDEFPGSSHTHDDRITSVTGARLNIAPIKKWKRIEFLRL